MLYTCNEHNIVNWLYFNTTNKKEILICWILWHRICMFKHTTHHLHGFPESRNRAEQLSISLLCHCHFLKWIQAVGFLLFPRGLQGRETEDREEEPKNCLQDFPSVSDHTVPLLPSLPLVVLWKNRWYLCAYAHTHTHTHTHTHIYI